jgi:hypothetical protein
MKRPLSLRAACLLGIAAISLTGWSQEQKTGEVTKLNGQKSFGVIEITDDYTIRVTSDTGLQKIPIAMLGESDFRKLGFNQDRSKDGRFWSERQDALETEKNSDAKPGAPKKDNAALELRLAEVAAFQPLIDAYEKSVADQKSSAPQTPEKPDGNNSATPMNNLFGQSGMGKTPFSGGFGSTATQPVSSATSAAASLVTPALPTVSAP